MGMSMFNFVVSRLQGLFRSRDALSQPTLARHGMARHTVVHRPVAARVTVPSRRPLRVVRVAEGPIPRAASARMVISGRLADVCAELDRLAALEAATA